MGILTSQKDLEAKRAAEDDRASSDIFSMSQDSTLPPVFRNMAKKGFDYIIALESEKELLEQRIAELEDALQRLISVAEQCDGWEFFPSDELDAAQKIARDALEDK